MAGPKTLDMQLSVCEHCATSVSLNVLGGKSVANKIVASNSTGTGVQVRLDSTLQDSSVRRFAAEMAGKVVGQPDAVDSFVWAYQTHIAGLTPSNRPVSVLLL